MATFAPLAPHEPVKVLLVDDLADNLVALDAMLRDLEVSVLQARSGREALELLLVHDVALALVDVQMPAMDGFELAELMRGAARTRHVPIIFVTAGARDVQRVFQGYDSGAVDFLFKPIEPRVLRNKVRTFMELYQQRARLAEQLNERERLLSELQENLRLNETFMAVLGHDLRNPLGVVRSTADLLLARAPQEAYLRTSAERLVAVSTRMARMIDELLDLARIRRGRGVPLALRELDLSNLAQQAVEEARLIHADREIVFHAAGRADGEWDEVRLQQVLSNLITNAVHHGAAQTQVHVEVQCDDDEARVTIANAGLIPADQLPRIFEPFNTGPTLAARSAGLGLGLFIVRAIAEAHGGSIQVCSSAERGTRFTLRLPRRAAASAARPRTGRELFV